jgi:mannose-6-phosphate isomerase-like protein (cupin superfamily)
MKKQTTANKSFFLLLIIALLAVPAACLAAKKEPSKAVSANFFAFDDADYHTSPDKRIGAKILVDPAKVGPSISSMIHLTYLPGAHITSHRHVYVTEIIYVLEGNLTLRIGDEIKVLGPNSTAYIPAKSFHEYLNDSTDVVKFLQHYSPSGPEEEYRNWSKPQDSAVSASSEQAPGKAAGPEHIVAPSLPPVPGSPKLKLGEITESSVSSATGSMEIKTAESGKKSKRTN